MRPPGALGNADDIGVVDSEDIGYMLENWGSRYDAGGTEQTSPISTAPCATSFSGSGA
jgi:hypothetical protein